MSHPSSQIKILLVEDDEDDFVLFRSLLQKIPSTPFSVERAPSYEEARTKVGAKQHDIYVVDYLLGEYNGVELLREFDAVQSKQPFIILTGAANQAVEKQAMDAGAADYLIKGSFDHQLLSRVLNYSLQRKRAEEQRIRHLIELNQSKDEFIAVASHELRTPATAVKQYIAMLRDGFAGDMNDRQRQFLTRAYDSNERQLRTIDDILRVARLDLNKVVLQPHEFDIVGFVRQVVKELRPVFSGRSQKITIHAEQESILVIADEKYFRMAITNIIDNASKYSHDGKTIRINIFQLADNGVVVEVVDQGVGINDKDLSKLYSKFSRISNPLSVQRGGTGLGLYWAREILRMHNGNVVSKPNDGEGTTFSVTLPPR